jgi:FkbM family methyltransferase
MYTLFAARAVGEQGRVFAFEPVPDLHRRLMENLAASGVANVSAHRVAISDRSGTATFYLGRSESMGSLYRAQTSATIEVPTETVDDFVDRQRIARVDAVKIDAEGAEMRIVAGMSRLLARPDRPVLFVEHNDTALRAAGSSAEELFTTLLDRAYVPHFVEAGRLRPVQALANPFHAGGETFANYVFLPRADGA